MKRETVFEILDQVDYEFERPAPPDDFPNLPRIPAARHFDPDFFEAAAGLGRRDARRWMEANPDLWRTAPLHDDAG